MKNNNRSFIVPFMLPVMFVIAWWIAAASVKNHFVLPLPQSVLYNFSHGMDNFIGLGSIPRNIFFSLIRVLLGYCLGVLVALPLGLVMGYVPVVCDFFESFFNLFKPVPPLAWQPLVLGWFGVNSLATLFGVAYGARFVYWDNFKLSMIFLIALGTFFPVLGNVVFGVKNVRKTLIESAMVLGAGKKDIFFRVLLPAAAPTIINGLRMGLATAWACLVGAEMLPGSPSGVGYLITHAYELARIDLVITGIICIGGVGWCLDAVYKYIAGRYFSWESKMR